MNMIPDTIVSYHKLAVGNHSTAVFGGVDEEQAAAQLLRAEHRTHGDESDIHTACQQSQYVCVCVCMSV